MDWLSEADHAALGRAKQTLRTAVRTRRTARSAVTAAADDHARCVRVQEFIGTPSAGLITAAYVSIPPEPSSLELISWLYAAGSTVLLPVLDRRPDGMPRNDPDWAEYAGPDHLRIGLWGIPEPTSEPLGADGLARAGVVICSGLAGTPQGKRLGMGGGWYDRALAYADPDAVLVLLLNDDEVLEDLPTQPWDRWVDVIATPTRLLDTPHR
jgi:5-formyltetrahydrofolate cyclo-ligase